MNQACRDALYGLRLQNASNAGLVLASYLKNQESPNDRGELFRASIGACTSASDLYAQAFDRWERTLRAVCVGETIEVDGRAIVGLGAESPLETGLTLHRTYGTPVIPGSALKGLASHYCRQVWASDGRFEAPEQVASTMFGTTDDAGHITFYDAWILPECLGGCLQMDVMTVHHPKYYQGAEPVPPTDFDDPTPIPFLSVAGKFRVFVQSDVPTSEGRRWASLALRLLREAMGDWGFGGKTSAGYGRIRTRPAEGDGGSGGSVSQRSKQPTVLLRPAERVQAILSSEKTGKGGWKAVYKAQGVEVSGHIFNSADVPPECKPGDRVALIVHTSNQTSLVFRWPK